MLPSSPFSSIFIPSPPENHKRVVFQQIQQLIAPRGPPLIFQDYIRPRTPFNTNIGDFPWYFYFDLYQIPGFQSFGNRFSRSAMHLMKTSTSPWPPKKRDHITPYQFPRNWEELFDKMKHFMYYYTGFPKLSWFENNIILFTSREDFSKLLDTGKPVLVNFVDREFHQAHEWDMVFQEAAVLFKDRIIFVQVEHDTDLETALFRSTQIEKGLHDFPFCKLYWVPSAQTLYQAINKLPIVNHIHSLQFGGDWSMYGISIFLEDVGIYQHRRTKWPFFDT